MGEFGLFHKKIRKPPLLRISMENSRGWSKIGWNSRWVCQNLRKKRGFPGGLIQDSKKFRGVNFKKIDILNMEGAGFGYTFFLEKPIE